MSGTLLFSSIVRPHCVGQFIMNSTIEFVVCEVWNFFACVASKTRSHVIHFIEPGANEDCWMYLNVANVSVSSSKMYLKFLTFVQKNFCIKFFSKHLLCFTII